MRISDWSSDVCSSDLLVTAAPGGEGVPGVRHFPLLQRSHASSLIEKLIAIRALRRHLRRRRSSLLISAGNHGHFVAWAASRGLGGPRRVYRISNDMVRAIPGAPHGGRSEEHTSELQSLMRISYAVFCL